MRRSGYVAERLPYALLHSAPLRAIDASAPARQCQHSAAAIALGSLYQFQLSAAQIAAVGPLVVTIQDRIAPADVRPAGRLFTFTHRPR